MGIGEGFLTDEKEDLGREIAPLYFDVVLSGRVPGISTAGKKANTEGGGRGKRSGERPPAPGTAAYPLLRETGHPVIARALETCFSITCTQSKHPS